MNKYTLIAAVVALLFLIAMWDQIIKSPLSVILVLGALSIVFGSKFICKLFKIV